VAQKDGQASISVSDNGEWIPEDKLDHIFERFYQTTSTVNDINTGTGIGLDLTRALVELHHGTIIARNLDLKEPATPGQTILHGVEFVVTIPLGEEHLTSEEIADDVPEEKLITAELTQEEEDAPPAPIVSAGSHPKIVVAEDDQEIREFLHHELSSDFDVIACVNGREALAEALKKLPDLVLSDIMMPEMDGNTLCSTLKSNPQTNHIPVILLTAKNRDEDYLEGLETGADAYVTKPFNMDILRRTIINLISTRQHLRLKYGRNDQLEEKVDKIEMKSPDEKLLERVMATINQNLNNADLSVDMIAEEVGISRVHLHRKMKELTNQTPHDFIRNLRLKQAARLLSRKGQNITEVMYRCGFNSTTSFSTMFKKMYGLSPREYMKEHAE
jgi:DNA-binding response OmpR family regulator